ncbi:MAG: phenylalanine--tRNA ligase subunit alpha [Helicobacteraceae bacterium]|nr:phenylalanine--tRNA ligase subunit alpha [Helicobacteraceae bacterium]
MNYTERINLAPSIDALEKLRVELLGKKSAISEGFSSLKNAAPNEKAKIAAALNLQKEELSNAIAARKAVLEREEFDVKASKEAIDVTLFDFSDLGGSLHPINRAMEEIVEYFLGMNFDLKTGPLVEDEFHNFEALNLPKHHPAREMQDTFYMNDGMALRTHTSNVQIHAMLSQKPPFKMIAPGAVFRRDYDLTHTPMFHQVEGLVVDEKGAISFANLKHILEDFLNSFFGDFSVRFRPSFFPFTEPSAEVDVGCVFCGSKGCRMCKNTGWLEVLGCGMVDPNVFKAVGYENVSGYAFGMGVERLATLKYRAGDLRSLYEGDLDLLERFR